LEGVVLEVLLVALLPSANATIYQPHFTKGQSGKKCVGLDNNNNTAQIAEAVGGIKIINNL
jgi:hypothetical protein